MNFFLLNQPSPPHIPPQSTLADSRTLLVFSDISGGGVRARNPTPLHNLPQTSPSTVEIRPIQRTLTGNFWGFLLDKPPQIPLMSNNRPEC